MAKLEWTLGRNQTQKVTTRIKIVDFNIFDWFMSQLH